MPPVVTIPESNPSNIELQKQYQDLKDKYEHRLNDLHLTDNECVTLRVKVDTYESKEIDLQHYITILKESILIKDQQVNMIQSEVWITVFCRVPEEILSYDCCVFLVD